MKARVLYNHLKKRMVVSGAGMGSGNKLDKVYARGRGTGYEVNMIYIIMLRSIGIRAYPAFVAPKNHTYQNEYPAKAFRYMVTYIAPKSKGKWKGYRAERSASASCLSKYESGTTPEKPYEGGRLAKAGKIVNAGNRMAPYGQVEAGIEDTWAFVADGCGGSFFRIRSSKATDNVMERTTTLKFGKDGSINAKTVVSATGSLSVKGKGMFFMAPKKWKKAVKAKATMRCGGNYTSFKWIGAPTLKQSKAHKPLAFSFEMSASRCLPFSKNFFVLKGVGNPFPKYRFADKPRKASIYLGTPHTKRVRLHLEFPSGYQLKKKLESFTMKAPGLQAVVRPVTTSNGLKILFEYQSTKRLLPAKDYPRVRLFFLKLKKATAQFRSLVIGSNASLITQQATPANQTVRIAHNSNGSK